MKNYSFQKFRSNVLLIYGCFLSWHSICTVKQAPWGQEASLAAHWASPSRAFLELEQTERSHLPCLQTFGLEHITCLQFVFYFLTSHRCLIRSKNGNGKNTSFQRHICNSHYVLQPARLPPPFSPSDPSLLLHFSINWKLLSRQCGTGLRENMSWGVPTQCHYLKAMCPRTNWKNSWKLFSHSKMKTISPAWQRCWE